MSVAKDIMDSIIEGQLMSPRCAESDQHNIVCVWSSGAEEQIEAIIADEVGSIQRKWESDKRILSGLFQILRENQISSSGKDVMEAYQRSLGA